MHVTRTVCADLEQKRAEESRRERLTIHLVSPVSAFFLLPVVCGGNRGGEASTEPVRLGIGRLSVHMWHKPRGPSAGELIRQKFIVQIHDMPPRPQGTSQVEVETERLSVMSASPTPEPSVGDKRPAEDAAESAKIKQSKYADQRKRLGASFGTRKAQKIQANRESNVIDTSNLGGVMSCLVDQINQEAKTVPSKESVQAKQDERRPVPKYNLTADTPQDAYKLEDLIIPSELDAMKSLISSMKKTTDDRSRITLLACRNSAYLNERLRRTFNVEEGQKPDTKRLRIIYFASLLMGLYINRRMIGDREKLTAKLNNPPSTLLDSVLTRFSERGSIDNWNADRLLNHLFVLGLYLDNFASELRTIQEDLQLRPPQIAILYKELGCTVAPLTETQRTAAGLSKSEAKSLRRAVLKVPLTFPPPKRGPAKR